MKLTGVCHTGFTVSDLERSRAFYRDLLGMRLVHRQEGTAPYLSAATGGAPRKRKKRRDRTESHGRENLITDSAD